MFTFARHTRRYGIDLQKLNSLTKYPSIQTYHKLDPSNGSLTDECISFKDALAGAVVATEKIDGTNSRIIVLPDGSYIIGSREELLYAQGDLLGNPALRIAEQLHNTAVQIVSARTDPNVIKVFYLELYGGKIGAAAKQYTTRPDSFGWRLFDVAVIDGWEDKATWTPEHISAWREGGGQHYLAEDELLDLDGFAGMSLTPRLLDCYDDALPTTVDGVYEMLTDLLPFTYVQLDDSGAGRAEGIVFRSLDRTVIAKARFVDYERTIKRRAGAR